MFSYFTRLNLQADKNFTESLWKHFMVEHGDISQAIDRVMQRSDQPMDCIYRFKINM